MRRSHQMAVAFVVIYRSGSYTEAEFDCIETALRYLRLWRQTPCRTPVMLGLMDDSPLDRYDMSDFRAARFWAVP